MAGNFGKEVTAAEGEAAIAYRPKDCLDDLRLLSNIVVTMKSSWNSEISKITVEER